jgi:protein phosphatase
MKTFSMTDIGVVREMNQDYLFTSDTPVGNLPNLYIVADGMGGHKAGEYASRYTTERVVAYVLRSKESEPVTILKEAIQKANELLLVESREDESKRGMGTTVVCATIIGNKMFVANVGDSRLYVVSDKIRQITRDHSLVEEMVRMGEMDRGEARRHPDKNIITRAVGVADTVDVDFFEVDLSKDDEILLCTDGLTNMVDDMAIYRIMKENRDIGAQVTELVHTANDNGGRDNITAVIIRPFFDEVKEC